MFTRHVVMQLKPGAAAARGLILENEVNPLLRGQKGLRHDDTFISPDISEAVMNSYWDTEGYAGAYVSAGYPAALKALSSVSEGTPRVETFGEQLLRGQLAAGEVCRRRYGTARKPYLFELFETPLADARAARDGAIARQVARKHGRAANATGRPLTRRIMCA